MSLIVYEVALVDLAVSVDKATLTIGLVVLPEAFVVLAIDPSHLTLAFFEASP